MSKGIQLTDYTRHTSTGLSADPRWTVGGWCCPSVKAMATVKQATLLLLILQQGHLHSQPRGDTNIHHRSSLKKHGWALHGFASTGGRKEPWKGIFLPREDLTMAQQVNRKIPVYSMFVEINTTARMVRGQFTPVLMPPAKEARDGEQENAGCQVLGTLHMANICSSSPCIYVQEKSRPYPQTSSHCSTWFTEQGNKLGGWKNEEPMLWTELFISEKWDAKLRMFSTDVCPAFLKPWV